MNRNPDGMTRRDFLLRGLMAGTMVLTPVVPALLHTGCGIGREDTDTLRRAVDWLLSRQEPDGSWRSREYAVLRSGQAYTPFVLFTLLNLPPRISGPDRETVRRGLTFIRSSVDSSGRIGASDPDILEYPNYSTAYALRVLLRAGGPEDRPLMERMTAYLAGEQFAENRGFDQSSPAYGSWGFGAPRLPEGSPGHVDLSHTRAVIAALREAEGVDPVAFTRAQIFLRMLQKHPTETRPQPGAEKATVAPTYDGGFYFSPVVLGANKGMTERKGDGEFFRSYASATCDGLQALTAAGVAHDDERVTAARNWLMNHARLDMPEGIPEIDPEPWHLALRHYHLAARGSAYRIIGVKGRWQQAMPELLADEQLEDGRFENHHSILMKEDDPVLCTALAVTALGQALTG